MQAYYVHITVKAHCRSHMSMANYISHTYTFQDDTNCDNYVQSCFFIHGDIQQQILVFFQEENNRSIVSTVTSIMHYLFVCIHNELLRILSNLDNMVIPNWDDNIILYRQPNKTKLVSYQMVASCKELKYKPKLEYSCNN